jgi:hypothetical protein
MPLVLNPVYFGARYPWKFEGIRDLVRRRGESEG